MALAILLAHNFAGRAQAVTNTEVFSTVGSSSYVVPSDVTSITVKLWGAGAGGGGPDVGAPGGAGGGGAFAEKTLSVVAGQTYTIFVGDGGGEGAGSSGGGAVQAAPTLADQEAMLVPPAVPVGEAAEVEGLT